MAKIFTITEGLENMGALRTGGQGSVYKARRTGQILTAVKLLPTPIYAENDNDKNFRDFKNEVLKLQKVNEEPNPNVVKILNSGITESGSLPFIEMEFIEGPDLEELLKTPHDLVFSIREVIKVADHLSNALAHCHKVGVKHGDIKSNNVKLNLHSGNYMLLDFGLAIMSDEQRRTSLRYAGAVEFMAPEQNAGAMLFETDIYSFGVVLFELLAGTVPFPLHTNGETSRNAVMISHMEVPVPDVLALRRSKIPAVWPEARKAREMRVPAWLLEILNKCLEKKPENRFRNGMELHEAIILNITAQAESFEAQTSVDVLKQENERLKALLSEYQKPGHITPDQKRLDTTFRSRPAASMRPKRVNSTSMFGLKPVVTGLVILFICLGLFAGFSVYNGRGPSSQIDTVAINADKQRLRDSIFLLEGLNAKRRQDSIKQAEKYFALQQKLAKAEMEGREKEEYTDYKEEYKAGKKRRKGFLGIRIGKRE
jgi:serine/threonine-protein kinase